MTEFLASAGASLYDSRQGSHATNLLPVLLASLGEAYGQPVAVADVFDTILALLSATYYTRRFAEDLEDVFPNIPLLADHAILIPVPKQVGADSERLRVKHYALIETTRNAERMPCYARKAGLWQIVFP